MTYGKLIKYARAGAMLAWKHCKEARTYEPGTYDAYKFDEIDADVDAITALWDAFSESGKAGKEVKA